MVDFGPLRVTRTTKAIAEHVDQTFSELKKAGYLVITGSEAAARHSEIVELDNFIKSPMTSVPDKVDQADSLIERHIQLGFGAEDQFWDYVWKNWKTGYRQVWKPILSASRPPVSYQYVVSFKETVLDIELKAHAVDMVRQFEGDSVMYLLANPDRYANVQVVKRVTLERTSLELGYESPMRDYTQRFQEACDFGEEVVLYWADLTLNYVMRPEHYNANYVLVIPPGGQQQEFKRETSPVGSADLGGGSAAPNNSGGIPVSTRGEGGRK